MGYDSDTNKTENHETIGDGNWKSGGRVSVEVTKEISFSSGFVLEHEDPLGTASGYVREAWLEHHWRKGGGLPIFIFAKNEEEPRTSDGNDNDHEGKQRVIAPVLMEERISSFPLQSTEQKEESTAMLDLQYTVTSPGPFFGSDLVSGSHLGTVTFTSVYSSQNENTDQSNENVSSSKAKSVTTTMTWRVEFETIRLLQLYQKVTKFTIGTASQTVAEAVQTPRLLTLRTQLSLPKETIRNKEQTSEESEALSGGVAARREWLDFLFSPQGGGLPLPPPFPFGGTLQEGGGLAKRKILRFPPGLVETAMVKAPPTLASEDDGNMDASTVYYQLENPGWLTFPFLAHTHLGRVTFHPLSSSSSDAATADVEMTWEVEIRPYPLARPIVEGLTEATVSTITRNLRVGLEEPGAKVGIKPPRGGIGPVFGSVPKATWIGRVLDAHSGDTRSVWEQTVSLLQPWTWGNKGDRDTSIECEWSDREMGKP